MTISEDKFLTADQAHRVCLIYDVPARFSRPRSAGVYTETPAPGGATVWLSGAVTGAGAFFRHRLGHNPAASAAFGPDGVKAVEIWIRCYPRRPGPAAHSPRSLFRLR